MNSGKSCIVNVCTNHCKLTLDCELLYRYVSQLANSEICFRKDRRQRDRFSPNSPMVSDSASSVSNARSQQFYKTSHWSKSTIHFFPVSQCWTCSVRIKPSNLNSFPDTKKSLFLFPFSNDQKKVGFMNVILHQFQKSPLVPVPSNSAWTGVELSTRYVPKVW